MYNKIKMQKTSLKVNESTQGERIERTVERMLNNKETITAEGSRQVLYTERDKGVIANYDIRTDKFEQAIAETEMVTNAMRSKNEKRREEREKKLKETHEKQSNADSSTTSVPADNS